MSNWKLPEKYDIGDGAICWACYGEGEPVVLLHGTPFSSFIWRDIAPVLASTYKVYVWDMLGFGASTKREDQDVSLAAQSRIFEGLLNHWGISKPWIVAHDVGGAVALRTILISGVPFRQLTLLNAVSVSGWGAGGFFQTIRDHATVFRQLPEWATAGLIEAKIRTASHLGLRPAALVSYMGNWSGPEGQAAFYRQYAQALEADTDEFQGQLPAISCPVRILWGREDQWLTLEYLERLRRKLPHAEFASIEGAGHAVQEDAPGLLLSQLMALPL